VREADTYAALVTRRGRARNFVLGGMDGTTGGNDFRAINREREGRAIWRAVGWFCSLPEQAGGPG
jgi:hypothetical protein